MLKQLGNVIQKRPWLVVTIVFLITIGFSSLIPSLEMSTSTEGAIGTIPPQPRSRAVSEFSFGSQPFSIPEETMQQVEGVAPVGF